MIQRDGLVALIDMDGTIADYHGALKRDLTKLLGPDEALQVPIGENTPEYLRERVRLIRGQAGWWRNLTKLEAGFQIAECLREYQFSLNILTKGPYQNPSSWTEKREWCQEHIPDALVTITEDKSLVYGKILVDDWPPYIDSWLRWRPRGWVIIPAQPWNAACNQNERILRYDPSIHSSTNIKAFLDHLLQTLNQK